MFVGSVSTPLAACAAKWVKHHGFKRIVSVCSGGFKIERMIRSECPDVYIHANDVGLLSCIQGALYTGDDTGGITFKPEMGLLNQAKSRGLAALILNGVRNAYKGRWRPTESNLRFILERSNRDYDRMDESRKSLRLDRYTRLDMADLMFDHDCDAVIGAPAVGKGWFEGVAKSLEDCVEWDKPKYRLYDPNDGPALCRRLMDRGDNWWMALYYRRVEDLPMITMHEMPGYGTEDRNLYAYGQPHFKTIRTVWGGYAPQFIDRVDPETITAKSRVDIHTLSSRSAANIIAAYNRFFNFHLSGDVLIVMIDGRAAGLMVIDSSFLHSHVMTNDKGQPLLYLKIDFPFVNKRRLGKLIAILSTSTEMQRYYRAKTLNMYYGVVTQVFTDKPMSMKYRSSGFKIIRRKEGVLSLSADWSGKSMQALYEEWFRKHAHKDR